MSTIITQSGMQFNRSSQVVGLEAHLKIARRIGNEGFRYSFPDETYREQVAVLAAHFTCHELGDVNDFRTVWETVRAVFQQQAATKLVREQQRLKDLFDSEKCPVRYIGVGEDSLLFSRGRKWTGLVETFVDIP